MNTPLSRRRDFQELERRRKRAARMFAVGKSMLAAIGRELKVSCQSASRWYREWKRGGSNALRGAGRAGRKPRLDRCQLRAVVKVQCQGTRAHGFRNGLWTVPRAARVIEQVTGVRYHPGHVWKILGTMDWTLQRRSQHAHEHDPGKVKLWSAQRWPAVKKMLGEAMQHLQSVHHFPVLRQNAMTMHSLQKQPPKDRNLGPSFCAPVSGP